MRARGLRVEWEAGGGLVASEPTPDEVQERAPELAAAYNDEHNGRMMGNTITFAAADVVAHYEEMVAEGARAFFLYESGAFVGDADVRNIADGAAELAILIASRRAQGKGLGTRCAILLHAAAFRVLPVERLYVTILPENLASRRVFEKIGHRVDASPRARSYVDDERDVSMSIAKGDFEREHATALAAIRVTER